MECCSLEGQTEKLSVAPVFPLLAQSACGDEGLTTIVGSGGLAHSSAFMRELIWKSDEIGGGWNYARTASTWVEQTRPVMALVAFSRIFSNLLV